MRTEFLPNLPVYCSYGFSTTLKKKKITEYETLRQGPVSLKDFVAGSAAHSVLQTPTEKWKQNCSQLKSNHWIAQKMQPLFSAS